MISAQVEREKRRMLDGVKHLKSGQAASAIYGRNLNAIELKAYKELLKEGVDNYED